ncbi:hypothetical protein ACI1MP_06075 [Kitasatospora griseola]|uniref:hypothetical protein n=1 Tax=Kitasatospora griseola TaxID=2064 RepID=UPI0038558DCA
MTNRPNTAATSPHLPAGPAGPPRPAPSGLPPRPDVRRAWSPPDAQSIELAHEVTAYAGRR